MDRNHPFPTKIEKTIETIDLTGDDELEEPLTDTNCRICLDMAQVPVATMCGHIYCMTCLEKALLVCGSCPVCRQSNSFIRLYC